MTSSPKSGVHPRPPLPRRQGGTEKKYEGRGTRDVES